MGPIRPLSAIRAAGAVFTDATVAAVGETSYENAKPFCEIPGPRQLPIVGNLLDYKLGSYSLERYHDATVDRFRRYGPLVRENIAGKQFVRVFDPEDVKTIFQNETKTPSINPLQEAVQMYRKMRNTSPGLGNTNGEEWYRLRSAVQQAMMRPQAVVEYLPLVENVGNDFVDYIRVHRSSVDCSFAEFKKAVSKWSLESSGMLVFEKRLGCLRGGTTEAWAEKLIDANSEMFYLTGKMKFSFPWHRFFPTPKWKRLIKVEDYVYGESRQLVEETINKVMKTKPEKESALAENKFNFMGWLLSKPELNREDVFILALSLFGDGLNTTAPMLIYNLYNLASNPDCQQRLYEEIMTNVPKDGMITGAVMNKLPYLKACVKETFRLFPVGTELSRIPHKNLVLSGYQVPADTPCDINVGLLLKTDAYFAQPKQYTPDRWLRDSQGSSKVGAHPFLFLPFGHGPRMCAGRRFSEQDLYVVVSRLVQNFKIGYVGGELKQVYRTLLLPGGTGQFVFQDRTK